MRWLIRGKFKLFREQTGFTLLEVLVAVAILAAIGVGFLGALNTNSRAARALDEQVTAVNLAAAYLEAIKEVPYDITEPYYYDAVAGITIPFQYDVDLDVDYYNDGITWPDNYTDEKLQRITVIVSREGKYILSICTYRTER